MSWLRRASVWLAVLSVMVPSLRGVAAEGEPNWWLLRFTAGDAPARFTYWAEYETVHVAERGPYVGGHGRGYRSASGAGGGQVELYEHPNDGTWVSTTRGFGSYRVGVSQGASLVLGGWSGGQQGSQNLAAGASFYILFFASNAVMSRERLEWEPVFGEVSLSEVMGSGAEAILFASPEHDGEAVQIGGAAFGEASTTRVARAGLAGAISTCNDCSGSWTEPDGSVHPWRAYWDPSGPRNVIENAWFAGISGSWRWDWSGTEPGSLTGSPVVAAYAPVGDAWRAFRCTETGPDACSTVRE